jgi:hypothetical protein
MSRSLGHAVLLSREARPEVGSVLARVDRGSVRETQAKVLTHKILPMY